MICLSSLIDVRSALILDTSVLINLHASTYGRAVLAALPNDIVVSEVVVTELEHETSKRNGEHQFLKDLISNGHVRPMELDDDAWKIFEQLTTSVPSIGDGEAATIAVAAVQEFVPVLDDAKGRSRSASHIQARSPAWSLDLLMHPDVQRDLADGQYIEAVYLALREGRMRIDEERCEAVVELIGRERALQCSSLPNFKARRKVWASELERHNDATM